MLETQICWHCSKPVNPKTDDYTVIPTKNDDGTDKIVHTSCHQEEIRKLVSGA